MNSTTPTRHEPTTIPFDVRRLLVAVSDEAEAADALTAAGYSEEEAKGFVRAWQAERARTAPLLERLEECKKEREEAQRHLTDAGNADRLVAKFGDRIRYVYEHKRWLAWDGTRWAPDATGAVERYAKQTALEMLRDAAGITDDRDRERLVKWAMASEAAARIEAMMKLARSHEGIVLRADDLDADPWALNVQNGTVDLRTGDVRPHDPAEQHSKITAASLGNPNDAARWRAFLEEVLPDEEVRHYFHKLAGYSIAGDVGENVLPFAYGSGANGKSVAFHVIRDVLGDYATEAAPDLLVARRERGIPVDVADLRGFRFVTTLEVEGGRRMATDVMKRITGEPRLKARRMRQDFESFANVTTLWMGANDRPEVDGLDDAIWRRVRLLPFTVTIPEERRDPGLPHKLLEERDAILGWLVEGMVAYHREGLTPPDAVRAATDEYRDDSNPLREWVDAECELDPEVGRHRPSRVLRALVQGAADAPGASPLEEVDRRPGALGALAGANRNRPGMAACPAAAATRLRRGTGVILAPGTYSHDVDDADGADWDITAKNPLHVALMPRTAESTSSVSCGRLRRRPNVARLGGHR